MIVICAAQIVGCDRDEDSPQQPRSEQIRTAGDDEDRSGEGAPADESGVTTPEDDDSARNLERELRELSLRQLSLRRNEIYARLGHEFSTPWLDEYFRQQDWYEGGPFRADELSEEDRAQVELIRSVEEGFGEDELYRRWEELWSSVDEEAPEEFVRPGPFEQWEQEVEAKLLAQALSIPVHSGKVDVPDQWEGVVLGEEYSGTETKSGSFLDIPVDVEVGTGPDGKVTYLRMVLEEDSLWHDDADALDSRYEEAEQALREHLGEPGGLEPWNRRVRPLKWPSDRDVEMDRDRRRRTGSDWGPEIRPVKVWRGDGHRLILVQYEGLEMDTWGLDLILTTDDPERNCGEEDGLDRFIDAWNRSLENEDYQSLSQMIDYPFRDHYGWISYQEERFSPENETEFLDTVEEAIEGGVITALDEQSIASCDPGGEYVITAARGGEYSVVRVQRNWKLSATTMSLP